MFRKQAYTMQQKPHWKSDIDLAASRFYIRRMGQTRHTGTGEVPVARLPLIGFIYVTQGEVLVQIEGNPYLCQTGHVLIIPAGCPFSIRYYHDASGYTGAFSTSLLNDTRPLRFLTQPVHQAFWFDEGVFMAQLFNMIQESFEKGDDVFIEKAMDLFLSRIKSGKTLAMPDIVNRFMESVFDPDKPIGNISTYASESGISDNYLSRLIKQHTGRSVGQWLDAVRIVRAKRLLASTTTPIIDVASAVGLDDQSYFARFFKNETGMTPTEFRKAMQEKS